MKINLKHFILETYENGNLEHEGLVQNFEDERISFIDSYKEHLMLTPREKKDIFGVGYIVLYGNKMIGYMYISSVRRHKVELEYAVIKSERGKGYGESLLNEVTDFLCNDENIQEIYLNISPSNIKSIQCALYVSYEPDYEEYEQNHYQGNLTFRKVNPYYKRKIR